MAEVPEDYDSGPDEPEESELTRPKLPGLHKLSQDAELEAVAEPGPEPPTETDQAPRPKTEEKDFKEGEPGSANNVQLKPTSASEYEIPRETERYLSSKIEPGISQGMKVETFGETEGELVKDLEVLRDGKLEEPNLELLDEVNPDVAEDVPLEPVTETDTELPTKTKTEIPEATISETKLKLLEETEREIPEELLTEQYKEVGIESPEQTTQKILEEMQRESTEEKRAEPLEQTKQLTDEKPKTSTEEAGLEPPEETKPEVPEEMQKEVETEPPQQSKSEFLDQKPRKSTGEADLVSPEETKPEVPEELERKSTEEIGTESSEKTKLEFPDQKPGKLTEKKASEPLEEIKSDFPEEKVRKPIEETSLELSEKAKKEIPEEIRRKSKEEEIPESPEETSLVLLQEMKPEIHEETKRKLTEKEPLEDTKPAEQKVRQRKSSVLEPPQKFKSEVTLREPIKEKGLEPPEQTEPEFPKKEERKSTEEIVQVPLQKTNIEVQEKIQTEAAEERNQELPDQAKSRETHGEFSKDRPEPVKSKYSIGKDELEYSEFQTRKSVKENTAIGFLREREIKSVSRDYESSQGLQNLLKLDDTRKEHSYLHESMSQTALKESSSESNIIDLSEDLEEMTLDMKAQSTERIGMQFECLKWSPDQVAEWISHLGFPQYKECFTTNFISGRKLIHVNCSNLPQMGITDFEDMKVISRHTRELLGFEEPLFSRSISLPYRDNIGLFLERKGHTGVKSDSLTLSEFVNTVGLQDYAPQITTPEEKETLHYTEPLHLT